MRQLAVEDALRALRERAVVVGNPPLIQMPGDERATRNPGYDEKQRPTPPLERGEPQPDRVYESMRSR